VADDIAPAEILHEMHLMGGILIKSTEEARIRLERLDTSKYVSQIHENQGYRKVACGEGLSGIARLRDGNTILEKS
jgi:hypothetical protein